MLRHQSCNVVQVCYFHNFFQLKKILILKNFINYSFILRLHFNIKNNFGAQFAKRNIYKYV